MGCEDMKDLLALEAGGDAQPDERIAVESHIAVCPECARELTDYRQLRAALAELREGAVPSRTFERIRGQVGSAMKFTIVQRSTASWFVRAAAVLVVGVSVGFSSASIYRQVTQLRPAVEAEDGVADQDLEMEKGASNVSGRPYRTAAGARGFGIISPPSVLDPLRGGFTFRIDRTPEAKVNDSSKDGVYYLPRVESFPDPHEVDF
ncbi:MAG: zf-HC2 domain-containing protein [Planctomycetes bacterium]|nr:zf-HC2 domain-containing protein [Planctomycetota bacterium]